MVLFLIGGLAFLYTGGKDLYAAVAVAVAFAAALAGAAPYMVEESGSLSLIEPLTGIGLKYMKLLLISVAALAIGCGAFALGRKGKRSAGAS